MFLKQALRPRAEGPRATPGPDAADPAAPGPGTRRDRPGRVRTAAARTVIAATVLWGLYSLLNVALSGRWWLWLLPDLVPPVCFVAVPVALLALTGVPARAARRWLVPALVLLLVTGVSRAGLHWGALVPGGGPGPAPAGALKVFSWNTKYWDTADDPDAFYRFLKAQDADVYLLQEYLAWVDDRPAPIDEEARIRREFPGYHLVVLGEQVTLSRFPVVARPPVGQGASIRAGTPWREVFERGKVLRTDVRVRGRVVSLYNVHIPVQLDIGRNWLSRGFYGEMRQRDAARRAHYAALRRDAAGNPNPLLVAGDFNTTPAMGDLDGLRDALDDALPASDTFMPGTWNSEGLGLWRLDWAFTNDALRVHRYAFEDPAGLSDHQAQSLLVSLAR
ncbi:endonuclease/exonuclease/phosphatase family protein [Streptomyces sp. NPDC002564]|uniref:endonuclease/exonuclease/phosphatase family protein n=1 Tax=Streptomyces sp. NPDC002564 TaxID=3364649 RepID=UPI0036AAC14E